MTETIQMITDPESLRSFCERMSQAAFITVDTEFMREKTYWPLLCLVQIAGPTEAACIDPMTDGMDLTPLFDLMKNQAVLKVFHAARQDLEIFFNLTGTFPAPLFDTQVAAMVCGFGDSVGYETLTLKLAKVTIDKSMRFTDWSRRPLSDKQLRYALSDVTHLRTIYEALAKKLEHNGRAHWLNEEIACLVNASNYCTAPEQAWRRLKARNKTPRFLGLVKELAAWREIEAQTRDIPRQRMMRDESLLEIAATSPTTPEQLERIRGMTKTMAEGKTGQAILEALNRGKILPKEALPSLPNRKDLPAGIGPIIELLKVLLKLRCEENDVAQKLVASGDDLELIALNDNADVPALTGWRREIFGEDALALKHGELALRVSHDRRQVETLKTEKT